MNRYKEKNPTNLGRVVGTLAVFSQNTKNIHWNIEGLEFFELHEETDKLYAETIRLIDDFGEKMVMHGELPPSSFSEYVKASLLKEVKGKKWRVKEAAKNLVDELNVVIGLLIEYDGKVNNRIQPLLDDAVTIFDKFRWQFDSLQS